MTYNYEFYDDNDNLISLKFKGYQIELGSWWDGYTDGLKIGF